MAPHDAHTTLPAASAQSCPDVDVVFARGTGEQPGLGPTGQAFVDALRPSVGNQTFAVYPVNYPATDVWATGVDGIRDAGAHVVSTAKNCPDTVAEHVTAVVLFGMPSVRAMNFLGEPPVVIGPLYDEKTIQPCAPEDPVCSEGMNFPAHNTYALNGGMIEQGAAFASERLRGPDW